MSTPETQIKPKLVHIGKLFKEGRWQLVFLRQHAPRHYLWCHADEAFDESPSDIHADSVQEAMRLAYKYWKHQHFRTLICGFRYTLPERDEHGINALFHQMAASLNTPNGVYFDEELGHNCFVQNASIEARQLLSQLRDLGKL